MKIDEFLKKEKLVYLSQKTDLEPEFKWKGCDICNNGLGNNVYECMGRNFETKEIQSGYYVCTECLYKITYGVSSDS